MPAAYRLAANAPRVAAAVVMAHPGVRLAAGAVGVVAWLASAKLVYDVATGTWREQSDEITATDVIWRGRHDQPWRATIQAACADSARLRMADSPGLGLSIVAAEPHNNRCKVSKTFGGQDFGFDYVPVESKQNTSLTCPSGWMSTPAGCLSPALEQPEFVDKLSNQPMPSTVPLELPYPSPLPVEQPFINPAPGENPSNRPYRVPTGQPSPIPNTDPQQWRQPYVDIVPAPTPEQPWRVDVKPGETASTNPNPVENPQPDAQDKPAEEQDKSLCEKHPDILACQKPELDTPDGEIPKTTKQVTYAEEGGFGGGSCPANLYSNIGGKNVMVYNWSETCGVVSTYLRPIILLLGAMGALFILIPGRDS